MKPNNPPRTRPAAINKHAADARTPRAIRFSESEWRQVRVAAAKRGISFGSFVRDAAMTSAAEQSRPESPALSSGIEELIKQTFRYAFVLASIKRDQFLAEGRGQEIEKAIKLAQNAQAELDSDSESA